MRSRKTDISPTCSRDSAMTDYWSDGTVSRQRTSPVYCSWTEPILAESTEYTTDSVDRDERKSWNSFEHYKMTRNFNRMRGLGMLVNNYTNYGYNNFKCFNPLVLTPQITTIGTLEDPTTGLPALRNQDLTKGIVPEPSGLSALINASLKAMLPGIRPEMSLVNSVIELKDFKTLPRTLKRVLSIPKRGRNTLRRILGGTADAYLQKEFNIMPLLSDISGFRKALANTKRQVDKLLELERKRLTRHFYAELGPPYLASTSQSTNTTQGFYVAPNCGSPGSRCSVGFCTHTRYTQYVRAQFHAEVEYTYYLSQYDKQNAYTKGLMDALGVNLNPAIIWNAIPWSFVVDWVVGVSQWLSQFRLNNLEPVTVIHRYLWSTDIARNIVLDAKSNVTFPAFSQSCRVGTYAESAYKRVVRPITASDITLSGVSLKEFSLAGALMLSRHKR